MDYVRTPEERFANLPEFPYQPHYVEVPSGDGGSLRMAYLDEGPRDAAPILLLHGEPSWSFLYRKMIRVLVEHGHRCVAPDLIGFGRSDKPTRREDYTYARHLGWLRSWLSTLDLKQITLVCQDWGGLLGLRLLVEQPERFARCVAANTMLPTGDVDPGPAFAAWKNFSQNSPDFPVGGIVNGGCTTDLGPDIVAAYDAPFPDDSFKAGARQFPLLVPATPDDPEAPANREAMQKLMALELPFLTAFSDEDPIMRGLDKVLQQIVPGAKGQAHTTIVGGGHFLQEDRGPELAEAVHDFVVS
ncbi:MAG: haloalkane dehalogenase [Polyangiaceae bacterium]